MNYLAIPPFRMEGGFVLDEVGDRVLVCFADDDPELIKHCDIKYSSRVDQDASFICPCGRLGQRMEEAPPHRCGITQP